MPKPGGCHSSGISLGEVLRLPKRHPACRRREAQSGSCMERENLAGDAKGKGASGSNRSRVSSSGRTRSFSSSPSLRSPNCCNGYCPLRPPPLRGGAMMPRPLARSNRQVCDDLRSCATPRGRPSFRFRRVVRLPVRWRQCRSIPKSGALALREHARHGARSLRPIVEERRRPSKPAHPPAKQP